MDIIDVYLESSLGQDKHLIYIKIPQRCKIGWESFICKIFKSLYGLKQAGRLWNKTLITFFRTISFVTINVDPYILTYWKNSILIIREVYVNDLALSSWS